MTTRERVLALLERSRGEAVSGGRIAGELGLSRNAVWKAVEELRQEGYRIGAVTRRGYCLAADNDLLSIPGMLPFLTRTENADRIRLYASLESTNKTAKELALSGAEHGTAVLADLQTDGKGRYGRPFYSKSGCGVYMSLVLRPERLRFETPTLLTAFAAVSVCEAVEAVSGQSPGIKWVNDIYLHGRKICGILTEAVTDFESGGVPWAVVGIGVNFSMRERDFPQELRGVAGSVFPQGEPPATRNRLAAEIMNRMLEPLPYDEKALINKYKARLMMLGEPVTVLGAGKAWEAVAVDVDDAGRLVVQTETGELRALSSGEIKVRGREASARENIVT